MKYSGACKISFEEWPEAYKISGFKSNMQVRIFNLLLPNHHCKTIRRGAFFFI